VWLKPRGAEEPVRWDPREIDGPGVGPDTSLDEAEFVALDVETTGNAPFLVLEIGAERFRLSGSLALFDTLVDCRAPINSYARKRHQIYREMLGGAPGFTDARRAFLAFAAGAALVEHSHDAFDTFLIGRGLKQPLEHPVLDTSALARLVLDLPSGQTPGLAAVVAALGVDATPAHAALSDAQATAAVFRELVRRAREQFGWTRLGDLLAVLVRPDIDRSALELPRRGTPPVQRSGRLRRRGTRQARASAAQSEQPAEGTATG
jgi:DNA polymerase-3 subunit epsilon